jgi:hypothetical protein
MNGTRIEALHETNIPDSMWPPTTVIARRRLPRPFLPLPERALHKSRNCHCEGIPSSLTLIRTGSDDRSNLISLIALIRDCFAELAMTECGSYAKVSLPEEEWRFSAEGVGVKPKDSIYAPLTRRYAPPSPARGEGKRAIAHGSNCLNPHLTLCAFLSPQKWRGQGRVLGASWAQRMCGDSVPPPPSLPPF